MQELKTIVFYDDNRFATTTKVMGSADGHCCSSLIIKESCGAPYITIVY